MQILFENRHKFVTGSKRSGAENLVVRTYQREIERVKEYFRSKIFFMSNQFLLTRLIDTGMGSVHTSPTEFYNSAVGRSGTLSRNFQMTSALSKGIVHDGVFYGKGTKEVILSVREYIDPDIAYKNWQDLEPVKMLYHPVCDFSLIPPRGVKYGGSGRDVYFASVDIPMLLLQYRGFVDYMSGIPDAPRLGPEHFLIKYALPNALVSQTDLVIMNRAMRLSSGAPMSTSFYKLPISIVDYRDKLDSDLDKLLKKYANNALPYEGLLQSIYAIHQTDMVDALQLPDTAPTRQVWWALLLSRLPFYEFLIEQGGKRGITANRQVISQMQVDFDQLLISRSLNQVLDKDTLEDTEVRIKRLIAMR